MSSQVNVSRIHEPEAAPSSSAFQVLPVETLADILEQGVDCTKISVEGSIRYMTARAAESLDIGDPAVVVGTAWADLWPIEVRAIVESARIRASLGDAITFEAHRPDVQGMTHWFEGTIFPVRTSEGSVRGLVAVTRDVTSSELARQALDTKTAEMRHRLRNSFAMIASLITSFSKGSPDREAFATQMLERLSALGAAQTLLATKSVSSCRVKDLMPAIVGPFDALSCPVTINDMSDAELDQRQADAIALVLGELAVNSDKHGALGSSGSIQVDVACHDSRLFIEWSERGARLVEARSRVGGQGLKLMDRVTRSLQGSFEIDWKANGLDAKMSLPL